MYTNVMENTRLYRDKWWIYRGHFCFRRSVVAGDRKTVAELCKDRKAKLSLNVYQKNTRAIRFYEREGFDIKCEGLDEATGEKDYEMIWEREPDL